MHTTRNPVIRGNSVGRPRLVFLFSTRGELSPVTYLAGLLPMLLLIFFVLDSCLYMGAKIAVEYAAYCAARAAVTQLPRGPGTMGQVTPEKIEVLRRAAAACLLATAERGRLNEQHGAAAYSQAIAATAERTTVRILDLEPPPAAALASPVLVRVEVSYRYSSFIPLSPYRLLPAAQQPLRATHALRLATP